MTRAKQTAWHWVPTSLQQVIDDEELPSHVRVVGISDAGRAAPISLLSCVMCVCVSKTQGQQTMLEVVNRRGSTIERLWNCHIETFTR